MSVPELSVFSVCQGFRVWPRVPPAVMRRGVRLIGRGCLDPALPWPAQRTRLEQFFRFPLMPRGTT